MKVDADLARRKTGELGKPPGEAGLHSRNDASGAVRYKRKKTGKLVKMRRVRRKKKVATENPTPNQVFGTDRVTLNGELGKVAPTQTKPNILAPKKPRRRSITPGLGNIIKKAVR